MIRSVWFPGLISALLFWAGWHVWSYHPVALAISMLMFVASGVFLADATARFRTYLKYRNSRRLINQIRILLNLRRSFCSRQVGIGLYGSFAKEFYRETGYKSYHFLPDGTFSRETPFLDRDFWRSVFLPPR